jgi:quercetin dioxygenase-like cupin family protein
MHVPAHQERNAVMIGATPPILGGERLSMAVDELVRTKGDPPWSAVVISNPRFVVTVICQEPGHHNDWHYHLEDECWYIYQGSLSWTLEGHDDPYRVSAGDWMLAPANTYHLIQVHGTEPAIRMAVAPTGEFHRHEREGSTPPEPARFVE